ncbi:MAG: hypothetical protein CVU42_08935 [Chloroflexi bacterium HGW-Chloroflexi-4]|nr:MAG: hypothetical protein CVU42_08935 [Chloroflexi bacterium HGW-Chloroflexi-4]
MPPPVKPTPNQQSSSTGGTNTPDIGIEKDIEYEWFKIPSIFNQNGYIVEYGWSESKSIVTNQNKFFSIWNDGLEFSSPLGTARINPTFIRYTNPSLSIMTMKDNGGVISYNRSFTVELNTKGTLTTSINLVDISSESTTNVIAYTAGPYQKINLNNVINDTFITALAFGLGYLGYQINSYSFVFNH